MELFSNLGQAETLQNPTRVFRDKILRLMLYGGIAGVGCMISGFLILNILYVRAHGPHYFTILFFTDVPYSPAFWGSALVAGLVQARKTRDRLTLWVGPLALLLLALLIVLSIPGYLHSPYEIAQSNHSFATSIWGELFSVDPNKCPGDECLGKILFTAPTLNCLAYSLGACIALRKPRQPNP